MMAEQIIRLEDRGQDFLWFKVRDHRIAEAGPFQNDIWSGREVHPERFLVVEPFTLFRVGDLVHMPEYDITIKYPVVAVEPDPDEVVHG